MVGAFKNINLIGKAKVDGSVRLTALNTTYALRGDSVYFLPDEIRFCNDTIYDRHNNIGIMTGGLHHHNFSNWTYDINVEAQICSRTTRTRSTARASTAQPTPPARARYAEEAAR